MRALRRGLLVLIVLGALFVGADRLAVSLAEDEAADRIKDARGISSTAGASVDIKGFPFLTQVVAKELQRIDVHLGDMTTKTGDSELTVSQVDAQLDDVRVGADYSSAVADRASGTALVSYEDVTKVAPNRNIKVGWGGRDEDGKGRVKVTGSFKLPLVDETLERSVLSTVSLSGKDTVELVADEVPGGEIPGVEDAVRERIDFARKIAGLPEGLELRRVEATKQGIELAVSGRGVELTG